ncbi:MAG TPA: ISAs1 family transposase [Anaerolineaceae bacterium]|nr:ISAs1 family transposase [Anaerolineaceae bacterium]HPN52629.1 ISAs1 family transposase [Anaerolineaceae bacterium]
MECNTKTGTGEQTEQVEGKIIDLRHMLGYLRQVKDGRKKRGMRYPLEIILVLFILAKLCGQNKIYGIADWAQQQSEYLIEALGLKYKRLPHHSTYRRVLTDEVEGNDLECMVGEYLSQLPRHGQDTVIAIDGKTVRGTITAEDPFGLHLLAAYLPGEGIVLTQMMVEKDKENEIVVAPKLMECLDLRQKVVIGDAMQTQRKLSIQIVAAEGDFVWVVKDNQANTRQAIEQLFAPEKPSPGLGCPPMDFRSTQTTQKQAGRLEVRTLTVSSLLNDYLDWPHLEQVFKLERRFTNLATGVMETEVQFGLTSLTAQEADPQHLLKIIRSEWGIENGLHYRRDVTYEEDHTRMTEKTMGRVMAIINNLVISLINHLGYKNHAHARRVFNACPAKALAIICGL